MINQYSGFFLDDHAWAMPVIAETYDGLTNDICGRHIKEAPVLNDLDSATSGFVVALAIEEAIVNAMVAAESMTTVKPEGYTLEAIDHNRLKQIMSQSNRLKGS